MASPDAGADQRSLLEIAVDVHTDLGRLATGLAHAGAPPQAVAGLQRMDGLIAGIVKALGNAGHVGAQPGQPGAAEAVAPAPGGPPAGPGPEGPPPEAGPPAAAPTGPPQGARPGERPNGLHEAAAQLQAKLATAHAAAQRQLAGH